MPHNFTLCFLMLHKVSVYTDFIECFLVLMDHCLKPMFLFPALGAGLIWLSLAQPLEQQSLCKLVPSLLF
jgi:hypothetical protein